MDKFLAWYLGAFALVLLACSGAHKRPANPPTGGDFTDADIVPLLRYAPVFPSSAAKSGITGWVLMEFTITESGTVSHLRLLDSHPPEVFDQAAFAAMLRWKYQPKLVDGKPVPMPGIRKKFTFALDD